MAEADNVQNAYNALVNASDALADAMGYSPDTVLRNVMPGSAIERRCIERIELWIDGEKDQCLKFIEERAAAERDRQHREKLMARIQLTPEEKKLLGIQE